MKALTERLDWFKMYINGDLGDRDDPKNIEIAQQVYIECCAISDAIPEFELRPKDDIEEATIRGLKKALAERPINKIIKLHD